MQNAQTKSKINHSAVISVLRILSGAVILIALSVYATIILVAALARGDSARQALLLFLLGIGQCGVLISLSVRDILLILRCRKLGHAMKNANRTKITALAETLGLSQEKLLSGVSAMLARGFLPADAGIDKERKEFVASEKSSLPAPLDEKDTTMLACRTRRPLLPALLYFIGLWLAYEAFWGFSRLWDYLIAGALSLAVLIIGLVKTPKTVRWSEVPRPAPRQEAVNTGNGDLDEVLTSAMEYMAELLALGRRISSPAMSSSIQALAGVSREIFDVVQKNPQKLRQIRQFTHYYLPTTLKLLREYAEFEALSVGGENVRDAMRRISEIMDTIAGAFKRELDHLYLDRAIDISADIEVLRGMIGEQD